MLARSSRCGSMIATATLPSSWSRTRTSLAILLTCIQTTRREWSDPGAHRGPNPGWRMCAYGPRAARAGRPLEDHDFHFQYRLLPQRHRGLRVDMLACDLRIAPDIAGSRHETADDPLAICVS